MENCENVWPSNYNCYEVIEKIVNAFLFIKSLLAFTTTTFMGFAWSN